jgi:diacylglycerol kinase (ATP)
LGQGGLQFSAEWTQAPGHASEIARKAVADGFRDIVSVGGDGTVNEILNGLVVEGRVHPDVTLTVVPGGTASDFARVFGLRHDPRAAAEQVSKRSIRLVDIGEIQCTRDGQPATRYFVNVAGLGFDSEVCARVNRSSKRFGGTIPYLSNLVITLFSYRNKDVELTVDQQPLSGRFNSVIICNGQYFGGGMWIGPQAVIDDGMMDVVILGDLSKFEFLRNVPRVYKGTHLTHPKLRALRAQRIHVQAQQQMFVQAEGELVGEAPAIFRVLPAALKLLV